MDAERAKQSLAAVWRDSIVPALTEYITIPNQSSVAKAYRERPDDE